MAATLVPACLCWQEGCSKQGSPASAPPAASVSAEKKQPIEFKPFEAAMKRAADTVYRDAVRYTKDGYVMRDADAFLEHLRKEKDLVPGKPRLRGFAVALAGELGPEHREQWLARSLDRLRRSDYEAWVKGLRGTNLEHLYNQPGGLECVYNLTNNAERRQEAFMAWEIQETKRHTLEVRHWNQTHEKAEREGYKVDFPERRWISDWGIKFDAVGQIARPEP